MGRKKAKTPSSAYKTVIINKMLLQFVDFRDSNSSSFVCFMNGMKSPRRPLTVCTLMPNRQSTDVSQNIYIH